MTNAQGDRRWSAAAVAAILMTLAAAIAAPAQKFTTVHTFQTGTEGNFRKAAWFADRDANLASRSNSPALAVARLIWRSASHGVGRA